MKKFLILSFLIVSLGGSSLRAENLPAGESGNSSKPEIGRSRKFAYNGFSGGMMLHAGYLWGGRINVSPAGGGATLYSQNIKGTPTGIGGAVKFQFGDWFRLGTEGHVSTLKYGEHGSNIRIGWGGLLVDCIWNNRGRVAPFAGVTVGGGSASNLTLAAGTPVDNVAEENASFREYPFFYVAPFAGIELTVTPRISIVMKADWLINVSNRQPDFPHGPRLYIGFLFNRTH